MDLPCYLYVNPAVFVQSGTDRPVGMLQYPTETAAPAGKVAAGCWRPLFPGVRLRQSNKTKYFLPLIAGRSSTLCSSMCPSPAVLWHQINQPKVEARLKGSCCNTHSALALARVRASPTRGIRHQPAQRLGSSNVFPSPAGCLPCGDAQHYSPGHWPSPKLFLLENTKASLSKPQKNHLVKIWA